MKMIKNEIKYWWFWAFIIGMIVLSFNVSAQEVKYNPNQIWITDLENLYTPEQEKELNQLIATYEKKTTCEIAILTTSDYEGFGDIGDYAVRLGEKWGVGKKDIDNGLMIVISKANDENFVASGYGLEGYLPDGKLYQLSDTLLASYFDVGEYFEGTKLFIIACYDEIGDEYNVEYNDENREEGEDESIFIALWMWIMSLPLWLKIVLVSAYILLWIFSPETAFYLTFFFLSSNSDSDSGSSFGGGTFGGGGARS